MLLACCVAQAGKLAIVIDDFGYRPATENQVLDMPVNISIAVLPDAPYAHSMAMKAHRQGREILIHLPMAPLSKQPLEHNTLTPSMSCDQVADIIQQAIQKVPYAVGLNNHMGSAMTSSLSGMKNVMNILNHYPYYFLDSMTIGNSQSVPAAVGTGVRILKRKVFLDNSTNEIDIREQFNRAIMLARNNGSTIAIGHPHSTTVHVLQQMLPSLPSDIILVRPSMLLNEQYKAVAVVFPESHSVPTYHYSFYNTPYCYNHQALKTAYDNTIFSSMTSNIADTWQTILNGKTSSTAATAALDNNKLDTDK